MVRRNVGQRANVLFDSIDLEILNMLDKSNQGMGVLELATSLGIKHKNLKPHIDKLRKLELIFIYKNNDNKIYLWTGMANMRENFVMNFWDVCDTQKEVDALSKEIQEQEALIKYLKKVKNFEYETEMQKGLELDLRKGLTQDKLLNTKIGYLTNKDNNKIIRKEKEIKQIKKKAKKRENDTNAPKPNIITQKEVIKK